MGKYPRNFIPEFPHVAICQDRHCSLTKIALKENYAIQADGYGHVSWNLKPEDKLRLQQVLRPSVTKLPGMDGNSPSCIALGFTGVGPAYLGSMSYDECCFHAACP